jgi:hypothetical protein
MNLKRKRKPVTVYYLYPYQPLASLLGVFLIWIGGALLICLILYIIYMLIFAFLVINYQFPDWLWALSFFVPAILAFVIAFRHTPYIRLVTHEDALEFHTIFKQVVIPWEDFSHLEVIESDNENGTYSYSYYLRLKDDDSKKLDIGLFVPVKYKHNKTGCFIDVDHLLITHFGIELDQYAPHVIHATREAENLAKAIID